MNSCLLTNIHCEGHAHRVLNTLKNFYFILRIEVGDSQRRGTTPPEEFDAHQEVSPFFFFFFCSFLVFHTWSETSHRCRHGESLPQCLLKKVYRDGAAQPEPPKDHRPHRQRSSASTFLEHFRGKFRFLCVTIGHLFIAVERINW